MAHIILPGRWFRQPPIPTRPDLGHPLLQGLSALWSGNSPTNIFGRNAVQSVPITVSRPPPSVYRSQGGRALSLTSADEWLTLGTLGNVFKYGSNGATIALVMLYRDTTNRQSCLFAAGDGSLKRVLAHSPWVDGNIYFDYGDPAAGGRLTVTGFVKTIKVQTLIFTQSTLGMSAWKNGTRIGSNATYSPTPVYDGNFRLGKAPYNSNADVVDIYLALVLDRAWSPQECMLWGENPWQVFTPPIRRIFLNEVAGGATTYYQTNAGSLGASGTLPIYVLAIRGGSNSPVGGIIKGVYATQEGSLVATGGVPKTVFGTQEGSLGCTGAPSKMAGKNVSGTVTHSGNISRLVNSALAGNVASAGTLAKAIAKALSASVATSASLDKGVEGLNYKEIAGSIATSGTLSKQVLTNLVGSIAGSGVLGKTATTLLAGNTTPTGALIKGLEQALGGTISSSASLGTSKTEYVPPTVDTTAIVEAIFAYPVEGTITFKEAIRLILAACAGDITYSAGTSQVIAAGGTKPRITAGVASTTRDVTALDVTD